ncbi:MAG: tetratricopeptide repeat protein [Verrucomicrobiota bacterium]
MKTVPLKFTMPCLTLALLFTTSIRSTALAQANSDRMARIEHEMEYARKLAEMGFADYAEIIYNRIKDPELKKMAMLQNNVNMGKFKEAREMIDRQADPDSLETWKMKLIMGDGYHAWGEYEKARNIYESFFEKYKSDPPESLEKFYLQSAYKYAQMLLLMDKKNESVKIHELMLDVMPEDDPERNAMRRQVLSETADLYVELAKKAEAEKRKDYFDRIDEIADEVLWEQDLWFGKMIVTMAHVKLIENDVEGATSLIEDYRPQLLQLDEALKQEGEATGQDLSRFSPMAECRYLIGVMMHNEAQKLMEQEGSKQQVIELLAGKKLTKKERTSGAYQHLLNVFIKYPGSRWAPEAGQKVEQIRKTLVEKFGARIKEDVTSKQMARVRKFQFSSARSLFNQNQFDKAAERYIKVLNMYPEGELSVSAISDLASCYMETGNEIYADTIIRYLAERFSANPDLMTKAGNETLKLANKYDTEKQMPHKKEAIYQYFFDMFTRHPRTPGLLFTYGDRSFEAKEITVALKYYQRITDNYPGSPFYYKALNKIARCYAEKEQYDKEMEALEAYREALSKRENPGQRFIYANYRLAYAHQRKGGNKNLAEAIRGYENIQKILKTERDKYQKNAREENANQTILAGAIFNTARCLALLNTSDEKRQDQYKAEAIKRLRTLVDKYPESDFAPPAYSQLGMLWTILEKPEQAEKALQTLRKKHPGTEEAKNATFRLAMSLLELGRRDRAIREFKEMFAKGNRGRFTERQVLTAGNELLEAGEHEIAADAFESVLGTADKRTRILPALLGKGKALTELGKYSEAVEALDKLLEDYPRSQQIIEACLFASRAYSEMAAAEENGDKRVKLFNQAVKRMRKVRQYTNDPALLAKSDLEVARIDRRKAQAEKKFGSEQKTARYRNKAIATYQILIMNANVQNEEVRPYIQDAYNECIPLMLEAENWDDVINDSNTYISQFPGGKYLATIQQLRSRAQTRQAMEGGSQAPSGTQEAEETENPDTETEETNSRTKEITDETK